jgi:hypothetical protein
MKHFKLLKGMLACLLSLALVFSCFEGVGLQAAETAAETTVTAPNAVDGTYDPLKDTITTSGKVIYVLKKESGNTIKAGAKCYEVNTTKQDENTLAAIGVKGTTKDVYLYICDKQFEAEGTSIKANLVIKAQAAKKIVGVVDYTQADNPESKTVLSIKATTKDKKEIADAKLIWSEDGTTWKAADTFTGADLAKKLEAGGGSIQVKMLGDEKTLTSKAIKVKIAKQGKAPAVKIDVKKDTFSIKNGMDYAIFTKSGEKYTMVSQGWKTVLPYLKSAKIKGADSSIVNNGDYLPRDKKDTDAATDDVTKKFSYTQTKVKTLGYNTINDLYVSSISGDTTGTKYYIGVRTSATSKKPASAVEYIEYSPKTEAPIVYTESCVSGQYLISSGNDFTKKGLTLSTIANYNGENGTTGYDDSFKLVEKNTGADANAASYEYTIVKKSDLGDLSGSGETIDWTSVSWKKLDPAKTKINSKLKSKYLNTSGTKVTAELKAGTISGEATETVPEDVQTLMLVRRAGVKGTALASKYQVLYVAKKGSETGIYSTKSVGEEAAPYVVNFYKWSVSGEGTNATYTWKKDDSLTITGWGGGSGETTEYVSFPSVEKADFFKYENSSISGDKVAAVASGTNAGKYEIVVPGDTTEKQVYEFVIREYANIKVVGVASDSGEKVANSEKTIATVKDGKVGSASGVTVYVGTEATLSTSGWAVPGGYSSSGEDTAKNKVSSTSGEGYTGASFNSTSGEVTVTVNTADEVTVNVEYPVHQVKVTYDINKGDKTTTATAPAAVAVNAQYKLAALADFSSFTATTGSGNEAKTYVVKEWNTKADGTGDKVLTSTEFKENTTVYAIWEEKAQQ